MASSHLCQWPEEVLDLIRAESPPFIAIPLITLDSQGFPHVALMTCLEFTSFEDRVFLTLRSQTRSAHFLQANPKCTLLFLAGPSVNVLKADAKIVSRDDRTLFELALVDTKVDHPPQGEGEAALTNEITFQMAPEIWDSKKQDKQQVLDFVRGLSRDESRT